jgi:glycosyltransferase involved in cell wall biosynthesis
MRVVYLADAPYVHTRRWVEHFARRGWDVHIITFRPADLAGVTVHHVRGLERIGRGRYVVHAPAIRRLVRELKPDLVHALHLTSYGFLGAYAGVHPLVTSVWGTDILEAPRWSPLHLYLTRYALERADHVTATGLRLANATLSYAPRAKPVTVVPYGVDPERFQRLANGSGAQADEVVIGSVGRLSIEKGFDTLLRAANQLIEEGARLRLQLVGGGHQRQSLERLTKQLGITDHVALLGDLEHANVRDALAGFDIFAMPSRAEGFGVAALEAQAMELPVVASDVHGLPDVVQHGRTGLLVPPGDHQALASALGRLIADPGLRASMGRAGREFVQQRYRWQDNAVQMERLYSSLLAAFTSEPASGTVSLS